MNKLILDIISYKINKKNEDEILNSTNILLKNKKFINNDINNNNLLLSCLINFEEHKKLDYQLYNFAIDIDYINYVLITLYHFSKLGLANYIIKNYNVDIFGNLYFIIKNACIYDNVKVLKHIYKKMKKCGCDFDIYMDDILEHGGIKCSKYILSILKKPLYEYNLNLMLVKFCRCGNLYLVKYLLNNYRNIITVNNIKLLLVIFKYNKLNIIKYLLIYEYYENTIFDDVMGIMCVSSSIPSESIKYLFSFKNNNNNILLLNNVIDYKLSSNQLNLKELYKLLDLKIKITKDLIINLYKL